ncbi:CmpA/NrtA family ABC transporter substrate-binding protein [Methyloversatilis thermotolerans]|uniref:CmpA/NrtA family ABC transporter substrate-binding protein n=1 Tax=Methyloversatilis thermotolerans TaxID=1346290 RepID=UPI000371909C|nr:CmpA/NrtA family ABC transporter substrate-binding protein [Methyloversatilis thermotolerans]
MPSDRSDDTPHAHAGCRCGRHASEAEHARATSLDAGILQSAALRAIVPDARQRRGFLRAVGASGAMAALSALFPFSALEAMADEKLPLEKKDLKVGFLPITCATPIILAGAAHFYDKEGLKVDLQKTAGWAVVRDKVLSREYDASHMLSPMPLAISMGLGSTSVPMVMPVMENTNGNAITLHTKHRENRDPKNWKGMRFAIPFDYSMHNFLLRHYLAAHGLDPDRDVQLRVMAPPDMVSNLRSGAIDGFIVAEPFNQRAVYDNVGFIHLLTSEIWDNHPCCAFAASDEFVRANPNTFAALVRALIRATAYANKAENRKQVADLIAPANYLNQPLTVVEQVLTGRFADGLGQVRNEPNRIAFDPFPWHSMAVWMLTQMKRWGYVKGDVNFRDIAERVFLATDARKRMAELGLAPPGDTYRTHTILGKTFDPAKPDAYLKSLQASL